MKKIVKILILCLSCMGACWLLPACSSAIEEPESSGGGDGSTVTLKLNAMVPGYETRAGGNEFSPEVEKIDNLRIFVVDKDTREVVYNSNFTNPFQDRDDEFQVTIDVEKNTTQVVYFLANAEEYCEYLPKPGEKYDELGEEKDLYNEIIGIPDPRSNLSTRANSSSERIPYTSRYKIEIEETNVEETCYIAIAAVKFNIVFNNNTHENITVSSLQIGGIANKSYLFPHNKKWDAWVENVTGNDEKAYFTNYEIPADTEHGVYPVTIPPTQNGEQAGGNTGESTPENTDNSFIVNEETSYSVPTFYCHESKNVQQPVTRANGSDTEGEQSYTIEFLLNDVFYVYKISNSDTDYLKSLIRSTHVSITININSLDGMEDHDIVIWGKIEDWGTLETVEGGLEPIPVETKSN
ncbi:hypothetical protein I6E18_10595 [Phocaeicola barnesiae]|uniref:hypothetical protein n=1 Tax=Phocaeicola barnesiae TaxID=376804 RepID=UPI001F375FCA|nr:hypothetical protein [Phocaeicola barnesiae]MCF2576601.1 hypothetical protein [Phocaeicola barnesiae]